MAKAAATGRNLSLVLRLFVLLSCPGSSVQHHAASLCYNFTVGKTGSGLWWHKVQCQLNEETFLSYEGNNCHAIGALGNRLNVTQFCEKQGDALKDGIDLFKNLALDMKTHASRDMQTKMCCWHEVDGHFNEFSDFYLNGHKMLRVDSKTGKCTEVDPGSSWMKEILEENKDVTSFLKMTLQGDCRSGLEELKLHWGKKLEPTASPTASPVAVQPFSMAIKTNISVLLVILMCLLLNILSGALELTGTEGSVGSGIRLRWVRSKEDAIPEVLLISLNCSILLRKEARDLASMSPASNNLCMFSLRRTGIMSQTSWE
ncbi:UL16-binding protein 1-like isoform X2 [Alexandromys fortis]|uniref:UL16-binding protein 1-like isoform X2 n=1 Tax=Alexandromys fortis TaxID=100897 RepID=UPI0021537B52|nr:UL16-binding protein 1-like isoform X2 [Microtus fortis]XP_050017595.1 UL16-binding protein 1-like isoform X2 [Microtus fortis]